MVLTCFRKKQNVDTASSPVRIDEVRQEPGEDLLDELNG